MSNLPGALDPGRIGQLSWTELPFRPTQDHVVVKLEPPAEVSGGVIIPASAQPKRGELVPALVVAVGPGAYDTRGRLIPMQVRAGDRVLVDGDCGWILGPHRVLRQGAVEAVLVELMPSVYNQPAPSERDPLDEWARREDAAFQAASSSLLSRERHPVDQAERDEYLARHKADLEARAKWLEKQEKP